jgi:hypothetical protein
MPRSYSNKKRISTMSGGEGLNLLLLLLYFLLLFFFSSCTEPATLRNVQLCSKSAFTTPARRGEGKLQNTT